MSGTTKGALAAMSAAILFGIVPVIGKLSYAGGSNAVMLTMFRSLLALPVLYVILKAGKISLSLTAKNRYDVILMGILGSTATTITLYESYNYISVGMATLIHFTFPSFVVLYSVLFLKEKMTKTIALSLVLSTAGLILFCDDLSGDGQIWGFILALISAIAFAFVMIYQYQSSLITFHPFKISFYQCVVATVAMLFFGLKTGDLTFALTPAAWFYSFLVAMFVSVAGIPLVQCGLQYIGSTPSSVLSLLEPITSVVTGILILSEEFTLFKLLGCILVFVAVVLFTLSSPAKDVTKNVVLEE